VLWQNITIRRLKRPLSTTLRSPEIVQLQRQNTCWDSAPLKNDGNKLDLSFARWNKFGSTTYQNINIHRNDSTVPNSTSRALASQHKASPSHDRENRENQEMIEQHSNTNPHIDVYLALMVSGSVRVPEPQLNSILYSPNILLEIPWLPDHPAKFWQAIPLSSSLF
jgi:hypothetical protein